MKKTIAILLLLIIAATMLCGCGKSAFDVKEHHGKRFETVEKYDDCKCEFCGSKKSVKYILNDGRMCCNKCALIAFGKPEVEVSEDA